MDQRWSFLAIGLAGGALVGAAAAFLTSPWSGAEARHRIQLLARKGADKVGENVSDLKRKVVAARR